MTHLTSLRVWELQTRLKFDPATADALVNAGYIWRPGRFTDGAAGRGPLDRSGTTPRACRALNRWGCGVIDWDDVILAVIVVAGLVIGGIVEISDHHARTIYRTPPACTHAAGEAAGVLTHNHRFAPLIAALEHPSGAEIRLGDNLPAFDGRVPDLAVCR